jgi:hypothetical protein
MVPFPQAHPVVKSIQLCGTTGYTYWLMTLPFLDGKTYAGFCSISEAGLFPSEIYQGQ